MNSLEDIEALVQHAHLYHARIYVTVNTILKEEELKETEEMIHALYRIGVDALIVQDMGITKLNLPPIPLHASTQMDNRTTTSFFEPVRTIPATIAAELGEAPAGGAHYQALFMLGAVLFLITLGLSIAVEYISSKRKI